MLPRVKKIIITIHLFLYHHKVVTSEVVRVGG